MKNYQIYLSVHVKILQKNDFVDKVWPAILFMFRPITLKELKSLYSIDTFTCLGGYEVTHPTDVQEVPGSIPSSGKDFFSSFFDLLLCFYF